MSTHNPTVLDSLEHTSDEITVAMLFAELNDAMCEAPADYNSAAFTFDPFVV